MGTWDKGLQSLKETLAKSGQFQKMSLAEEFVNELTVNQLSSLIIDMGDAAENDDDHDYDDEVDIGTLDSQYNEIVDTLTDLLLQLILNERM